MNSRIAAVTILAAVVLIAALACKMDRQAGPVNSPADALAEEIGQAKRTSEVRVFSGDALWEYINGDAEIYHQYGFTEVATADYKVGDIEVVADVYRFTKDIGAYGLYSVVRPDDPVALGIGVEGFVTGGTVSAVKGEYFVRLVSFSNESAPSAAVLTQLAQALVNSLPGTTEHPATFSLFPAANRLPAGDRYFASSFAGQAFLTDVYAQGYLVNGDTVVLFLMPDSATGKFAQWQSAVTTQTGTGSDLPFDNEAVVAVETFDGNLIAGVKGSYLAGMVKYAPRHKEFLAAWVSSLPAAPAS